MFATSATKVLEPGSLDFIFSSPYQIKNSTDLVVGQPKIGCELDRRFEPELRFPLTGLDMDVHPTLFPREEEGSKPTLAKDGRTQLSGAPNGQRVSGE